MKNLAYYKAKVVDLRNMIGKDDEHRRAETYARRCVARLERKVGIVAVCIVLCLVSGCWSETGKHLGHTIKATGGLINAVFTDVGSGVEELSKE